MLKFKCWLSACYYSLEGHLRRKCAPWIDIIVFTAILLNSNIILQCSFPVLLFITLVVLMGLFSWRSILHNSKMPSALYFVMSLSLIHYNHNTLSTIPYNALSTVLYFVIHVHPVLYIALSKLYFVLPSVLYLT